MEGIRKERYRDLCTQSKPRSLVWEHLAAYDIPTTGVRSPQASPPVQRDDGDVWYMHRGLLLRLQPVSVHVYFRTRSLLRLREGAHCTCGEQTSIFLSPISEACRRTTSGCIEGTELDRPALAGAPGIGALAPSRRVMRGST